MRINPVLLKELKVKMRGWRAVFLIGGYNLVLTLITIFMIKITQNNYSMRVEPSAIFATYAFMVVVQYMLIGLIAPALSAGAISGERERQTLDILMSTTLSSTSIIIGKLLASLSHIILLIVSSIPVFSVIFLYGIIGVKELGQVFLFYIISAIMLGSIGIFFSTFIKKSTVANVLTYAVILFLVFGTLMITILYVQLVYVPRNRATSYDGTFWLIYFNPLIAIISLLTSQFGESTGQIFQGVNLSNSGILLWQVNAIINAMTSIILLGLSAFKLNPTRRKLFSKN